MAASLRNSCFVLGRNPQRNYKGQVKKCYENDVEYSAFLGIPYAVVPIGVKRFQAPESLPCVEPAMGKPIPTYKANVTGKICMQALEDHCVGSSDCLYLNIFVPTRPENIDKLLPVLVYIHGGGFVGGSNDHDEYTPDLITQYGLVFVTINYRLGMFGFLNARTMDCPGNAGLKDQVKALEWIRDNIECFKGDPNNVTISGNSAGGTCVNIHLVAPASRDLFHKAIVQSGGIYTTWGYRGHRRELKKTLSKHPLFRNYIFEQPLEAEAFIHFCEELELDVAKRHPETFSPHFGPTVEKFVEGAFIPENIEEMMKKVDHNKPVMAGITKEEGIAFISIDEEIDVKELVNNDLRFRKLLMDNLRWTEETTIKHFDEIRNKYFPRRFGASVQEMNRGFTALARDFTFRRFYDNFRFGPQQTVHKNLYVYRFDHVSEISAVRLQFSGRDEFNDATHGDELKYLYCPTKIKVQLGQYIYEGDKNRNKTIQEVMNHMCSLWANFCKTGAPKSDFDTRKVKWKRHTERKPCYLIINKDLVLKEEPLFKDEWEWLNARINSEPTVQSSASVTPEEDVATTCGTSK